MIISLKLRAGAFAALLALVSLSLATPAVAQNTNPGSIVAWGNNNAGQCNVPVLSAGLSYTRVAAGDSHTVTLRSDGAAVAWGWNNYGQTTVPTLPAGLSYTQVAAGYEHTVALRSDGSAVAWGQNNWGQTIVPDAAVPAKPQEPQRPVVAPVVAPVAPDRPYNERDVSTWTDAQLEALFANEANLDLHTGEGERALSHARARLQEIDERLTQGEASVRSGRVFSGLFGDDATDYQKLADVSVRQIGAILDPYALRYLGVEHKSEIALEASALLTQMDTAQKRLKGNPVIAAVWDPVAHASNLLYDAVGLEMPAPILTPADAYAEDDILGAAVMLIPIFKALAWLIAPIQRRGSRRDWLLAARAPRRSTGL